jgi:hypothetical protein
LHDDVAKRIAREPLAAQRLRRRDDDRLVA